MITGEIQNLRLEAEVFTNEPEQNIQTGTERKETKSKLDETASKRDYSSVFARLKKSARKKSAAIL